MRIQRHWQLSTHTLLMVVCTIFFSCRAMAWAQQGHELAGHIAERYLTDSARSVVIQLLPRETLADASTWADRMRSDPSRFWQKEASPYHYVTVPPGRRYAQLRPPPSGDAVTALSSFARDLRNPETSLKQRRLALRFALHIIQDLHQPLHVGNGQDRGGNTLLVRVVGKQQNFHRLWDYHVIAYADRSTNQWLEFLEQQGLLRTPTPLDFEHERWIGESAALRDSLYPPPTIVDDEYLDRHGPQAARRIALAGIRSAAWINAVLTDETAPTTLPTPAKPWWRQLLDAFSAS
jgi:hypothetical protein